MEKLIKLLNEYSKLKEERYLWEEWKPIRTRKEYELEYPIERIRIISRQYWFIKWLVDNDKIDTFQLAIYIEYHSDYRFVANRALIDKNVDEDHLLMLLSISDTPIDDLISYLK